MRALVVAIIVMALALGGCSTLAAALPILTDVIAKVTDGIQILDQIQAFVDRYFAAHPNEAQQKKVGQAIATTRSALNVALRTSRGAKELSDEQADAAFADFKVAYKELLSLVGGLDGVKVAPPAKPGEAMLLSAGPDTLSVPEPLALRGR